MKKDDFKKKIFMIEDLIYGLYHDHGVLPSSALYAFLLSANTALAMSAHLVDDLYNCVDDAESNDNC